MVANFRFGILGAARIARVSVAPAILASSRSTLWGLSTRNPEKTAPFVKLAPDLKLYDCYNDLLEDPSIDAVYIPLPNHLHFDWSISALAAGKHVLCEKPLAMSADDIDRLHGAALAADRHLSEGLMAMYHPQWKRVHEIISSGEIGHVCRVDAVFSFFNSNPKNIRNRLETGGGAIRDLAIYPIALTQISTGRDPIVNFDRISVQSKLEGGVDIHSSATIPFPGFELSFSLSMRLAPRQEMIFHCSEGWLRLTAPFTSHAHAPTSLELFGESGRRRFEVIEDVDQYQLMVEAFVKEAQGEQVPKISLEFSRRNQELIDSMLLLIDSQ